MEVNTREKRIVRKERERLRTLERRTARFLVHGGNCRYVTAEISDRLVKFYRSRMWT